MKLASHSLIIAFLSVFVFNSCKNDLKLNAPYKEIPSIYAVINPQEKIQMIRINKVFLGEGNANTMAQVADSINYPAGELTVTLNRFVNGAQVNAIPGKQTITFRDSMVQANTGSFNTNQRIYVCSDDLHQGTRGQSDYKVSGDYVLTVKNNRTGNIFTAKSTAIDSVSGNQGFLPLTTNPVYPYPPNTSPIQYIDYTVPGTVRFAPNSAVLYQLTIRMHFYDSLYNNQKIYDYVDYDFTNQNIKNAQTNSNGIYIVSSFKKNDLFTAVGIGLGKKGLNNNIPGRKMYKIQFLIYSTTQDYFDYTQYLTPSLSISQNKPLYSNFDNQAALGLFTFRARCSVTKEMSTTFVSEFATNPNTCAYRFRTASSFSPPGCN